VQDFNPLLYCRPAQSRWNGREGFLIQIGVT
jgi:hypothetical protein